MKGIKLTSKNLGKTLTKNSPAILTIVGTAGVITTAAMAVRSTPKAMLLIGKEREDRARHAGIDVFHTDITMSKLDTVKLVWKCYIPSVVMGALTISCIVSANSINLKRNAAIASMYSLADTTFKEYQSKVVETIGNKKEREIKEEIIKDRIAKKPPTDSNVIITGSGEVTCFDAYTGRYFKHDIEGIRRVVNELNKKLLSEDTVNLNDLYYELDIDGVKMGEELGWRSEQGLIEIIFTSILSPTNEPCLSIEFDVSPIGYYDC